MTTKMKGLLKGLRYISQIFEKEDDEDEEEEMQIGFPTDVKHVAHIGWDGPAVSSPSWMSEFKSSPEVSSAPSRPGGSENKDIPFRTTKDFKLGDVPKTKHRSSKGDSSSFDSTNQEGRDTISKNSSRRQKSSDSSESTKPSRRNNSNGGSDSASIPKQSKKKKSKGSSSGGGGGGGESTRSRSKGSAELPIITENGVPTTALKALELED